MSVTTTEQLDELKSQFAEFLKQKMYRNTQERYRVLERIAEVDQHFSADELYLIMHNQGDRVSRATIYSTLDLLTRCNILVKHRFQGESATYELRSRMPHHDHLLCTECGHIVEFNAHELEEISKKIAQKFGYKAVEHSYQIFAMCPDSSTCTNNPANTPKPLLAS
ncbi:MAG: transcriptional repressor [Candidatus Kapaibacterium sp.]